MYVNISASGFFVGVIGLLLVLVFTEVQGQFTFCSAPGILQNGYRVPKDQGVFHVGHIVHFYCNTGYKLKGPPKIECEKDGKWSAKLPTCTDECGNQCKNGGICNKRESVAGTSVYSCTCRSGFIGRFCETVVCLPPPPIENLHYNVLSGVGGSYFQLFSVIQFSCTPGFRLNGSSRMTCTATGLWSRKFPTCSVITCRNHLNPPTYRLVSGSYTPKKATYQFGEVVSFTCDKAYVLRGSATSECLQTGFWSTNLWPQCVEQLCPTIVGIKYGYTILQEDSTALGTKVRYNCARGYYLYGQAEQICKIDGNGKAAWSGRQPMCITRSLFEQYCAVLGKVMVVLPEPRCELEANVKQTVIHTASMDTMAIVTGTAGGILGFLLVIIAIVACQRRRLVRRMRLATSRRPRSWSSEDDRMAFICYSNDVRFILPSYDEAMRTRPPEPPPFEAVANDAGRRESRTTSNTAANIDAGVTASTGQENSESEEHPYETIDALPINPRLNPSPNEPIYAAVQRVLSPFARTLSRLSSSGSQGETTNPDSTVSESTTETAVEASASVDTERSATSAGPMSAPTTCEGPQGAEGGIVTARSEGESTSKGKKKHKTKDKKDKKMKKKGGWQLTVSKSGNSQTTTDEVVKEDDAVNEEGTVANMNNSSESLTDDDENKPLISDN